MRRVHAVGYYGWDNFGDDLFREVVSLNRDLIWGEGTSLRTFVFPISRLHQNPGLLGSATRILETAIGTAWADTIALCGGSVMEDVQGTQLLRDFLVSRMERKSLEAIGISLGPWPNDAARHRVMKHLDCFKRVVVRDHESMVRSDREVILGGDLAALYPMPSVPPSERFDLTICPSNDAHVGADELSSFILDLVPGEDVAINILALNTRRQHGDLELSQAVAENLRANGLTARFHTYRSIPQVLEIISQSRAVWSQRLHGLIVAYLCEVPILALSHHQKIADFATDIGLNSQFICDTWDVSRHIQAGQETLKSPHPIWELAPQEYRKRVLAALVNATQIHQE